MDVNRVHRLAAIFLVCVPLGVGSHRGTVNAQQADTTPGTLEAAVDGPCRAVTNGLSIIRFKRVANLSSWSRAPPSRLIGRLRSRRCSWFRLLLTTTPLQSNIQVRDLRLRTAMRQASGSSQQARPIQHDRPSSRAYPTSVHGLRSTVLTCALTLPIWRGPVGSAHRQIGFL